VVFRKKYHFFVKYVEKHLKLLAYIQHFN